MQRHRRLARAGPALDDEHPPAPGGDDPVLLGLDRRHDVAHAAVAGRAHGGDESALALQARGHRAPVPSRRRLEPADVDELVLHAQDRALPGLDVPPAHQAHRVGGGRLVEGPRQRGAPVQDHLAVLGVLQPGAPHVVPPAGVRDRPGGGPALGGHGPRVQVHAAEHETVLDPLQGGDQVRVVHRVGVPLPAGLVGAADLAGLRDGQGAPGLGQLSVELAVGQVDDLLLGGDLALAGGLGGGPLRPAGREGRGGGGVVRVAGLSHMTSLRTGAGAGAPGLYRRTVRRAAVRGAPHYSPDRTRSTTAATKTSKM